MRDSQRHHICIYWLYPNGFNKQNRMPTTFSIYVHWYFLVMSYFDFLLRLFESEKMSPSIVLQSDFSSDLNFSVENLSRKRYLIKELMNFEFIENIDRFANELYQISSGTIFPLWSFSQLWILSYFWVKLHVFVFWNISNRFHCGIRDWIVFEVRVKIQTGKTKAKYQKVTTI